MTLDKAVNISLIVALVACTLSSLSYINYNMNRTSLCDTPAQQQ